LSRRRLEARVKCMLGLFPASARGLSDVLFGEGNQFMSMDELKERMKEELKQNGDVARIKEDLAKLGDDFRELFEAAIDLGKHRAGDARETFEHGVQELKNAAAVCKAKGGEAASQCQATIKEHPIASLAVAFGVGLIAGRLLMHRK